ncbi:MAG: thioether cross-link-forming SCIFF peptide maturase [Lachnospirales bacterium]
MIHKYSLNGYNIVIDVHSNGLHVFDDVSFNIVSDFLELSLDEIIKKFENKYNHEDIISSYEEIASLKENGKLFTEDISEAALKKVVNRDTVVKALCLHIAHDCNLKCEYCFAEEGEYHGGKRSLMSAEIGKKALDLLFEKSGTRRNLEVDLFGGEPLINFEVVKEIVDYGRELEKNSNKKFRFTLTTNGTLLNDDNIEYIVKNMSNVVLSIDGRKEVNDRVRYDYSNKGTYDKIVEKFQNVATLRNQTNYYVRGTFTRYNLDFAEDVMHLAELGFKQISVEPVVTEIERPYSIREEDLPQIFAEYEKLANYIIKSREEGKWFNFFHFMIDLNHGPCLIKRVVGCGAGSEYLAVTPTGELYPCHQFVGVENYLLGDVYKGVVNEVTTTEFSACNIYAKDECRNCWNKFYCSGGCSANAKQQNDDIYKPYEIGCEMQKKRTECALMIKVHEILNK